MRRPRFGTAAERQEAYFVAIHEAGHSAAALIIAPEAIQAALLEDADSGRVRFAGWHALEEIPPAELIAITMAGPMAEARARGLPDFAAKITGAEDAIFAVAALRRLPTRDAQQAAYASGKTLARLIIADHWQAVEAIARRLVVKRRLSQEQLITIFTRTIPRPS